MLRIATITILIAINISVWVGPAESILVRSKNIVVTPPGLEQVEKSIINEDLDAAYVQLTRLVAAEPDNGIYHYELGMFCYLNSGYLLNEAGWTRETLIETVQRNLRLARRLQPESYNVARQYARVQIDERFFDYEIPRESAIEAWQYTLDRAIARHERNPNWDAYPHEAGHALLNMARIEARSGHVDAAQGYLDQIPSFAPDFRIPENVIKIHANLATS